MKVATILISLIISGSIYGQADFSGMWKLNTTKSEFNNVDPSAISTKLSIEQKAGTINIQRNERPTESYKIDSTTETEVAGDGYKVKVSMKPTPDRKGLIETRSYVYSEGKTGEKKKTRTWRLSGDKKALIIDMLIELSDGQLAEMTLVYDRQ